MHHLAVILFPSSFIRNPFEGPQFLPPYLCTDGLTPAHTTVPIYNGMFTGEQLTRYVIPSTDRRINLVPTAFEVFNGFHPSTLVQVSIKGRPAVVLLMEQDLQEIILNATSEASACLGFINRIDALVNTIYGGAIRVHPIPGATLSTVLHSHSHCKELCLAAINVLNVPIIRRKLGALHPVCLDQLVKILFFDSQTRNRHQRRLRAIHGENAVDAIWPRLNY